MSKVYVHFGGDGYLPMLTVSFKNKRAARRAIREARKERWPARLQESEDG